MLKFLRLTLIVIWIAFASLIGMLFALFRPFSVKNTDVVAAIIRFIRKIVGIKIEVRNPTIAENAQPCVFVSNHQDSLDVYLAPFAVPTNTTAVAKKSLIYIPFLGQLMWLSGVIFIKREDKKSSYGTLHYVAKIIDTKKISVWIMPEGTRSAGRGLMPFKNGPFVMAIKAGVPIVPIVFSSYLRHLKLNQLDPGKVIVEILPPISTQGLTMRDVDKLKQQTRQKFQETIDRIDKDVEKILEKN